MSRARAAVLVLAAVSLAMQGAHHTDDTDASLYTVVARHLVEDGAWLDLRYTENVHPHYREHLPFGLWPSALVVKALGEGALPWLSVTWTLLTIALLMELGRRLFSEELGVLAGFLLATTHQFIVTGALHRLDPPLVFFSLLSVVPLLGGAATWRSFALTALAMGAAVAIKGPFGLVLPAAATVARALSDERRLTWLAFGAGAGLLAVLPVTLFLGFASADWWTGYVEAQLLASASGARTDGTSAPWFPLIAIGSHFWPWLLLVPFALRRPDAPRRRALIWLGLSVLALALPGRKLWHHVLLVFPALALVAASAVPLERLSLRARRLAALAIAAGALVTMALVSGGRAVSCREFREDLALHPRGTRVLVVAAGSPWREIGVLAGELELRPWLEGTVEQAPADVRLAIVSEERAPASGWHEVRRARGWVLLERD
ncbi:MAG: ArnT family glycosyltransferase [Myxococcota bacterium]